MKLAILMLCAALSLTACVEIRQEIAVTPGLTPADTPAEIDGAKWQDLPVAYCIANQPDEGFVDHDELVALTEDAFAAWGVDSRYEGDCAAIAPDRNGVNEIAWGSLRSDATTATSHQSGQTSLQYRIPATDLVGDPQIVEADIVIEMAPPSRSATDECLFTTLLHEVGHFLGARHSEPPAVMAPALSSCPQELEASDVAQITALYGDGS